MILDTSSLIAVLADEPDSELYIDAMSRAQHCRISAGNFLELSIVIEGQFGAEVLRQCDALFRSAGIVIESVTVEQAQTARQAFHDFGKGRHQAALNYGDCFAYALAKTAGEPLLFKGEDFKKTDISSALP
ncbi:MAG TPA: type II toxin-antitoxin system VapC family toxin [Terriglobales bacterium]|nr:type II toxin-antitoxin system VapC family toxin [Terriglobales bacterium]